MNAVINYTITQEIILNDIDAKNLFKEGTKELKDVFTAQDLRALGYKDLPVFADMYGLCIEHLIEMDIHENGITDFEIEIETSV